MSLNQQDDDPDGPTAASPTTEESVIEKMRRVVKTQKSSVIDGLSVDEVTAKMVIGIYDRLQAKKKEKFGALSAKRMIGRAFEIQSKE